MDRPSFDRRASRLRDTLRYAAVLAVVLTAACGDSPSTPDDVVIKTLQVAPSRAVCTGVGPQLCLQVRETASAPWTNLYGEIVGFDYQPGFLYEIRIKEEIVANPPADGSSIRRTLIAVLRKISFPPS
jgi:hypothetical protein